MHELSLCGAIADIANRRAGDREVDVVHVRIGQLRQVVPDTLVFCWSLVTTDTELAGSVLEVENVAALLTCESCRAQFTLADTFSFVCPHCGGFEVTVDAGEEFLVTALELAEV